MRFSFAARGVECARGFALGLCFACGLLVLQGCGAGHRAEGVSAEAGAHAEKAVAADAANPDPSVRVVLRPSEMLVENPAGLGQSGVVKMYGVRGTPNQLSLYFDARANVPERKDLAAYSAWADGLLPGREIKPFEIGANRNPIREAGLPYVARTYVNLQRSGGPAPTAICDAAGLRFETPGGFWTISCNSDLGKIDEALPAIDELLRVMDIERVK